MKTTDKGVDSMHQFECRNCGYDMTGIEKFSNNIDMGSYSGFGYMMPTFMSGFYDTHISNTVTCPNCGKSGQWIKH